MGLTKKLINVVSSKSAPLKKKFDAETSAKLLAAKEKEKALLEAKMAALGAQQAGTAIKGQGGDGSLLTGAGGVKDPSITGKKTLLGAQ